MRITQISSSSFLRLVVQATLTVFLFACAKLKTDTNLPVLNTLKSSNSSIRMVTLAGPNQVTMIVNGYSFNLTPNNQTDIYKCPYTSVSNHVINYNPVGVPIPYKLFDQAGNAHIRLISYVPTLARTFETDTVLKDDASNPADYYIFPASKTYGDVNYNIIEVPRSTTPPAGVSNIKIRLVNLGSPVDTFHLTGPLTLTYMDGSPVSTVTTGVPAGVSSAYTEIPYGTYHFRLFTQTGLEVPEALTPAPSYSVSSIHSFQPGGIYTIFVNSNNLYILGNCGSASGPPLGPPAHNISGNSYSIIADIPPPSNISFAKVQFVNTIPGKICSLLLDGFSIGNSIAYRGISPYQAISLGDYSMQLLDDQGQTIARQNITLNPDDNFTIWAYVKNGQPNLTISFNDLTNPNAGQKLRFMNCSVNVPYITFTHGGQLIQVYNPSTQSYFYPDINDTTSAADATENLAQGVPASHQPFTLISYSGNGPSYPIAVNQSNAGPPPFVPGVTLPSVKQLSASDFIFNSSLYPSGNGILAAGVFTVALTGTVDTEVSGHPRPDTLLIVKHFN